MREPDGTGCTGKRRYESRTSARSQADHLRKKLGGKRMHVYRCPVCDGFHLSSHTVNRAQAEAVAVGAAKRLGIIE